MTYTLKFGRRSVPVASLADASATYAAARDASGLGGSRWPEGRVEQDGKFVGRVSYNGRIWASREWRPGEAPIFDNRAA